MFVKVSLCLGGLCYLCSVSEVCIQNEPKGRTMIANQLFSLSHGIYNLLQLQLKEIKP